MSRKLPNDLNDESLTQDNPEKGLVKIGQAAKILGVSIDTLRRWEKAGKVSTVRTPGGTRVYSVENLKSVNKSSDQSQENPIIVKEEASIKPQTPANIYLSTSELLQKQEKTDNASLVESEHLLKQFTDSRNGYSSFGAVQRLRDRC